ncbi:MAG TPA: carboxypeptidase-like regulatory domain-containing protein, partial [Acidobacteriaceae bacterium]|nr:carboxypeptidase-like regulatory domain-containing protein [Acidobacteriaceae bacterium]
MSSRILRRILLSLAILPVVLALPCLPARAQSGTQGKVVVTVQDTSGAVVPGTTLRLVEHQTNDTYTASTNSSGAYTFVNLPIGTYTLTISRSGYANKVYSEVIVQASQVTDLTAQLTVGATTQTVQVAGQTSPLLQTTSNAIGSVVDMKQIQNLPLSGRDLTSLASIVPGFTGAGGQGTFNGLPIEDEGSNMDGMVGSATRMKFDANLAPAVSPRLEDIEQMSVQTDQLGLNSGFGQATTQINFVSRRGGNQFHGSAFEDFRNSGLYANSWHNDAAGVRKGKEIRNDFGVSAGGPVLHDKLFFFGTYAMRKIPGSYAASNNAFTQAAQSGNFTYGNTTVNLLTIAQNHGLPSTVNAEVAKQFSAINTATGSGKLVPTSDPNFNEIDWVQSAPETDYYPVARIDYNASQKARFYLSWMMTQINQPGNNAPTFPGSSFANQTAGNQTRNFTGSFGFDYIFSPALINQLKAG